MNTSINSLVQSHCSHIKHPFTLEEICQQIQSGEYNAELLLQHLLLFMKELVGVEGGAR